MTTIDSVPPKPTDLPWWAQLTVAHAVLALIVLIGAALRLSDLGGPLLRPDEAGEALAVWGFWQPAASAALAGSPAYFTLTGIVSQLFGFGEAALRLIPALAGIVLVTLPWLLRHHLGQMGALAAALLLAVSPTAVASARTAGGDSLAISAALLLFISLLRYQETGERRWLYALSGSLGFGLATAPIFYGLLLTLALAGLTQRRFGPALVLLPYQPERDQLRAAALVGGIIFAAAATFFLWQPAGFGAALSNLGQWLSQFSLPADPLTWLSPILALGRYEIGILVLGTAAIAWATWRNLAFPTLLVYWFSAGLLLLLLQGGTVNNVLLLVLPGYLLLAALIEDSVAGVNHPWLWPAVLAMLALTIGTLANASRHVRSTYNLVEPGPTLYLFGMFFCLLVLGAGLAYLISWRPRLTLAAVMLTALFLLAGFGWGTAWWLGHDAHNDTRERWVESGTDGDVRSLLTLLTRSARHAAGSDQGLSIVSGVDSPILRWYLRDRPVLAYGANVAADTDAEVLITTADGAATVAENYVGQTYGLRLVTTGALPSTNLVRDIFAWWIFHDTNTPPVSEKIILWLRADLVPGQTS